MIAMKKICVWMLAAILLCGNTMSVKAQSEEDIKHEVAIGLGGVPNSTWINALENVAVVISTLGAVKYGEKSNTSAYSAEYFYRLIPMVGIGGIATYNKTTRDLYILDKKEGESKVSFFTVMPAVKLNWLSSKNVGIYTKLGVGATFRSESEKCKGSEDYSNTEVLFNFQASLLGVEAGSRNIRGFVELGVGEQGMGIIGLRCRF